MVRWILSDNKKMSKSGGHVGFQNGRLKNVKKRSILGFKALRDLIFVSIVRFSDTRNPVETMKVVCH